MTDRRRREIVRIVRTKARLARGMDVSEREFEWLDMTVRHPEPHVQYDVADLNEVPKGAR